MNFSLIFFKILDQFLFISFSITEFANFVVMCERRTKGERTKRAAAPNFVVRAPKINWLQTQRVVSLKRSVAAALHSVERFSLTVRLQPRCNRTEASRRWLANQFGYFCVSSFQFASFRLARSQTCLAVAAVGSAGVAAPALSVLSVNRFRYVASALRLITQLCCQHSKNACKRDADRVCVSVCKFEWVQFSGYSLEIYCFI